MTLDTLAKHISTLLKARSDVAIPTKSEIINDKEVVSVDLEMIIPLIHQNMLLIANRYKVLGLVTKSSNFRVLRVLKGGYFIRMPKEPRNLTDKIDLDLELHIAVANFVAADLAKNPHNRNIFKKAGRKIVKDYSFKIYNTPAPE